MSKLLKYFSNLPVEEANTVLDDCSCAMTAGSSAIPNQGHLWITPNYVCFYANILQKKTKILLKFEDVLSAEKKNTAMVVANAIQITTRDGKKHFFTSFVRRDQVFDLIEQQLAKFGGNKIPASSSPSPFSSPSPSPSSRSPASTSGSGAVPVGSAPSTPSSARQETQAPASSTPLSSRGSASVDHPSSEPSRDEPSTKGSFTPTEQRPISWRRAASKKKPDEQGDASESAKEEKEGAKETEAPAKMAQMASAQDTKESEPAQTTSAGGAEKQEESAPLVSPRSEQKLTWKRASGRQTALTGDSPVIGTVPRDTPAKSETTLSSASPAALSEVPQPQKQPERKTSPTQPSSSTTQPTKSPTPSAQRPSDTKPATPTPRKVVDPQSGTVVMIGDQVEGKAFEPSLLHLAFVAVLAFLFFHLITS